MKQILEFLLSHCLFLFEPGCFRFDDSGSEDSFGGDAFLVLESNRLRIRFVRDRGQLFLDFQGTTQRDKNDWYSIDVVQQLVTGEKQDSAELSVQRVAFVEERIEEIETLFAGKQLENTRKVLKKLERARAKSLFG